MVEERTVVGVAHAVEGVEGIGDPISLKQEDSTLSESSSLSGSTCPDNSKDF